MRKIECDKVQKSKNNDSQKQEHADKIRDTLLEGGELNRAPKACLHKNQI